MQTRKALLTALSAAAGLLAAPAPSPAQETGPCGVGAASPTCLYWHGKVTFISDGDTISVDLAGHKGEPPVRVRITGIQAMEQTFYSSNPDERRGECHALEATSRLQHLIEQSKGHVRLAAQDRDSMSGKHRVRRQVSVRIRGQWRDVGRILMNEGQTLPLAGTTEWAFNRSYRILAQRAAERHVGLWDTSYCGDGPEQLANLRVRVRADPEGRDGLDLNGEYVTITNEDPVNPVPIGGWWVRDNGLVRFVFPPGTTVPAGGTVTLHTGQGVDDATAFFWNRGHGVFDNVTADTGMGDGAYLFDPDGDLRAWMTYPCEWHCSDALQGAVKVTGHPRGHESATVTNVSAAPIDLDGYQLVRAPHSYAFPASSVLQPGESMRVFVTGSPDQDTPLVKHWGLSAPFLRESPGDHIELETLDYILLSCDAWGSGSCPQGSG